MAFDLENLNSGAQPSGQSVSIHSYETTDADTVVEGDGYFDEVDGRFDDNDLLYAVMDTDGTAEAKFYRVTKTTGDISLSAIASETA